MKLLLHACCGPCTLYPASILQREGISFSCYFFNPNIHPYSEFQNRLEALRQVALHIDAPLLCEDTYGLTSFLRSVVYNEAKRCDICYDLRLAKSAAYAKDNGFDAFTTTLLYSKYQNHALVVSKCLLLAEKFAIKFYYRDFREGWQQGIEQSKHLQIYRQRYCGCIYSEQEAFEKTLQRKARRATPHQ